MHVSAPHFDANDEAGDAIGSILTGRIHASAGFPERFCHPF
jgi:hypothetical protein